MLLLVLLLVLLLLVLPLLHHRLHGHHRWHWLGRHHRGLNITTRAAGSVHVL
jgi:hypothetical protein